jgi:hypothetical protein
MHIDRVTITGADDEVNPEELIKLHRDFPFLELGILFSKKHQGTSRYPSEDWLMRFFDLTEEVSLALSAHLCGQYVRDLIDTGLFTWLFFKRNYYLRFSRIQLNMGEETFTNLDLKKLATKTLGFYSDIILQSHQGFARADEVVKINKELDKQFIYHILHDASGGMGVAMTEYPVPVPGLYCGYAGGLNPANVGDQLKRIEDVAGDATIWIDAETGIRDPEDKFDLESVRQYLSIVQAYCR